MAHPEQVVIKKGYVPDTFIGLESERFAFVNLDMDLFRPQLDALRFFCPRMSKGGVILVHDYYDTVYCESVRAAVDEAALEYSFKKLPIGNDCSIALFDVEPVNKT